jgi:hypothetical protein
LINGIKDNAMDPLESLRYPVGRMVRIGRPLDAPERAAHVAILESAPARFQALAQGVGDRELDQPYRPGGWTLRQVFHHVPDSHLNAYVRMRLAMTEESPQVKTYDEGRWAELVDARTAPIDMSLMLLDGLHRRWVAFLRSLSPAEWQRAYLHPDWGTVTIEDALAMYSWHCRHHAGHIEQGSHPL